MLCTSSPGGWCIYKGCQSKSWCTCPPAPACVRKSVSGNSSSAGATLLSQHAATRKDHREEQTKGWFWQGYSAEVWLLEKSQYLHGAQCSSQPTSGWRLLPARHRRLRREAWGQQRARLLGQPSWWLSACVHEEDLWHLCWDTDTLHHDEEHSVHAQPSSVLFFAYLTLPFSSQLCPSISIHSCTSPAFFYPEHHLFLSIYVLLCCAIHLKVLKEN